MGKGFHIPWTSVHVSSLASIESREFEFELSDFRYFYTEI